MSSLLFLCTGNSCRSQMAEAFARLHAPQGVHIYSAGMEKHGLNPRMLDVMAEAGVDMSPHYSKTTDELPAQDWELVVTVCDNAAQRCPCFPGATMHHMPFDDPPALTRGMDGAEALPVYRRVRDEIHAAVAELMRGLAATSRGNGI